jgi:iron complex outermembrane receptor protein
MPMLLEFTPSAVVTSDAGNGVGYTGIRIRGSDATRINVTINGVPYNDAESQQTYWVDLPDFASSVDDIQIQRGVGTSSNGISSFGGAIHIHTNDLSAVPFAHASIGAGSFNLWKASTSFGTGAINRHWFAEGRFSRIQSDGYIDRSFADLSSVFLTGAYQSDRYKSVINIFSGEEHTYQSWRSSKRFTAQQQDIQSLYL